MTREDYNEHQKETWCNLFSSLEDEIDFIDKVLRTPVMENESGEPQFYHRLACWAVKIAKELLERR